MASAKDALRSLTPPMLWQVAHRLKSHFEGPKIPTFEGPFSTWEAAALRSDGWDAPAITTKTLEAALKVKNGLTEFEQDGIARKKVVHSATILAFLLLVLSRHQNAINLIDFGGGLGSSYVQNRKILRHLAATSIRWSVVERAIFAKLGLEHFQTTELKFFSNFEDSISSQSQPPDALLFSGSLQYVADPFSLIDRIVGAGISILALDRILVSPVSEHAVFIQHPDPNVFYPASYPVWCFSKSAFVAQLAERGFVLVECFTTGPDENFDHCGMLLVKRP